MMKIEKEVKMVPRDHTVAEKVVEAFQGGSQDGIVLVPDGDTGLKVYYRGTGGAWWVNSFNERGHSVRLETVLQDVDNAVLIKRDDVDAILSGDKWLSDGSDC